MEPSGQPPTESNKMITRRNKDQSTTPSLHYFILVALWAVLVFGGFYTTKVYFDRSIKSVQQTNAINIQALEDRLDNLSADMKSIESALKNAGQSLSSSDSTQKELNRKIEDLDRQLRELEKSLKILKEAPNAPR